MSARLRPLVAADVPRVLELESELFGAGAWSEWMIRDELAGRGRFYVALEVGRDGHGDDDGDPAGTGLVGYAGTWFDGVDAQVMTLGVASAAQGRGYGRVLLDALLAHERGRGAQHVFLEVRVDNGTAISLYEAAGFERLGVRRGYYQPENVDALTMRLALR